MNLTAGEYVARDPRADELGAELGRLALSAAAFASIAGRFCTELPSLEPVGHAAQAGG